MSAKFDALLGLVHDAKAMQASAQSAFDSAAAILAAAREDVTKATAALNSYVEEQTHGTN